MAFSTPWEAPMALSMASAKLKSVPKMPSSATSTSTAKRFLKPLRCAPLQQFVQEEKLMKIYYHELMETVSKFTVVNIFLQNRKSHWRKEEADQGIMCEPCNGKGWLLCDFCNGEKTNVKGANNRIYRRCPSCRAIGYNLCSKCKVFKCITFPNYSDGEDLTF